MDELYILIKKAELDNISDLVRLRTILINQGDGHYVPKNEEEKIQWQQAYIFWLKKHLNVDNIYIIIAINNENKAIGCATAIIDIRAPIMGCLNGRMGWIQSLVIEQNYRGKSIGSLLIKELNEWFKSQFVFKVALQATPKSEIFYRKNKYFSSGEDLLIHTIED